MVEEICKDLQEFQERLFRHSMEHENGEIATVLSKLSLQVKLQKSLSETTRLIQENCSLPVRRITYNVKALPKKNDRWEDLNKLSLEVVIFCLVAFPSLDKLPSADFEWLLHHINGYLVVQKLPSDWIRKPQIKQVISKTGIRDGTLVNGKLFTLSGWRD